VEHSPRHTIVFTVVLCVVFSVIVSSVAVGLKDRQDENVRLDRIKNVLGVAGLKEPDEKLDKEEMIARFESGLEPRVVDLATGEYVDDIDPLEYDQQKAKKDPELSRAVSPNPSKVRRVPNDVVVYLIHEEGKVTGVVLPIEGYGLWSTLYGYLALAADGNTVRGITYYSHGETPGLGGEVDNPRWKAKWAGRKVYDAAGNPQLHVKKGQAGPPSEDPFEVDGLSGASLTSKGVSNMLAFWMGRNGFAPYLAKFKQQGEQG